MNKTTTAAQRWLTGIVMAAGIGTAIFTGSAVASAVGSVPSGTAGTVPPPPPTSDQTVKTTVGASSSATAVVSVQAGRKKDAIRRSIQTMTESQQNAEHDLQAVYHGSA